MVPLLARRETHGEGRTEGRTARNALRGTHSQGRTAKDERRGTHAERRTARDAQRDALRDLLGGLTERLTDGIVRPCGRLSVLRRELTNEFAKPEASFF